MTINEPDLEIKMILLGETGVGKTSIISRYIENKFLKEIPSSTSMSYAQKVLIKNNLKIQLNIWDTVGQEKLRSLSKLFFNDSQIVILVYSIDSEESFKSLDYWLNQCKEIIGDEAVLGIAGNKSDLYIDQKVEDKLGIAYAEKNRGIFGLISAKNNKVSLDEYIDKLVTEYLNKNPNLLKKTKKIKLSDNNDENQQEIKAGCCSGNKNKRIVIKYSAIIKEEKSIINVVFLGDNSVGKTSIINRINKNEFKENEIHTDYLINFNYKYNNNKMKLDIIINDVDNNKKKTKDFVDIIKKSSIIFFVYDVKNKDSLDNIEYWIDLVTKMKDNINKNLLYILGNKNDKKDGLNNTPLIEEGKTIANDNNALFKAISAKDDEGIIGIIEESVESYLAIP